MATQLLPVASKDNSSWFPKSDDKKKKNVILKKNTYPRYQKNSIEQNFSKNETVFERGSLISAVHASRK